MTSEDYVRHVDLHLRDLPWRTRRDLIEDLRVHLNEVPSDDLVARFGSPAGYAAELRSAAGLGVRRGPIAFLRARRPRNVVVAVVVAAGAGLVIAALLWARSYQPVEEGSFGISPDPSRSDALGETVAPFRNGRPFQFGFSIRNDGRFSVRIVDVPLVHNMAYEPFSARVFVSRKPNQAVGPFDPFHPFELGPGDERLLVLRGTYANCDSYAPGGETIFHGIGVRTEFLWWERDVLVDLNEPLVIQMPRRDPCSGP